MIKQIVIESEDVKDALRHIKSVDLAICIYDIQQLITRRSRDSQTCILDDLRDEINHVILERVGDIDDYLE